MFVVSTVLADGQAKRHHVYKSTLEHSVPLNRVFPLSTKTYRFELPRSDIYFYPMWVKSGQVLSVLCHGIM